jgi:N-acetylglucosaminyldiphosphoundecaprenol N-acetyl-beta-D-mannosaminyltransferase
MRRSSPIAIPGPLGRRRRPLRAAWVRSAGALTGLIADALRRSLDIVLAAGLLVGLLPLLLARAAVARVRAGRVLERAPRVGRFRTSFELVTFADAAWGRSLPMLLNVLRGDLSFVGPRPLWPDEAAAVPLDTLVRFDVRPGLVSLHTLRRRTAIAHGSEHEHDRELVYGQTVAGDLGLMARAIPAALLGAAEVPVAPPVLSFFGVDVVNTTMDEAVEWIVDRAADGNAAMLAFVNPDCLNVAFGHNAYRAVLRACDRVLPDGIGIHIGCRLLGTALKANVNGTDLFPRLCERLAGSSHALYLLGARPGVAAAAAAAMQARVPGLRIAGARDGYFTPEEEPAVIDAINASGADILLVAFGVPRQELWLATHAQRLRPRVRMGVGGLFDFYSGRIPRAPMWMREIGLEWVWRLLQEPRRMWRRYVIGNPLFLWRVWREASGRGNVPPATSEDHGSASA